MQPPSPSPPDSTYTSSGLLQPPPLQDSTSTSRHRQDSQNPPHWRPSTHTASRTSPCTSSPSPEPSPCGSDPPITPALIYIPRSCPTQLRRRRRYRMVRPRKPVEYLRRRIRTPSTTTWRPTGTLVTVYPNNFPNSPSPTSAHPSQAPELPRWTRPGSDVIVVPSSR